MIPVYVARSGLGLIYFTWEIAPFPFQSLISHFLTHPWKDWRKIAKHCSFRLCDNSLTSLFTAGFAFIWSKERWSKRSSFWNGYESLKRLQMAIVYHIWRPMKKPASEWDSCPERWPPCPPRQQGQTSSLRKWGRVYSPHVWRSSRTVHAAGKGSSTRQHLK